MTYEKKLEETLNHLVSLGNTEEEATEILAGLMHDSVMTLPQRGWYKDDYVNEKRIQKNTARVELCKLPHGKDIYKEEDRLMRS